MDKAVIAFVSVGLCSLRHVRNGISLSYKVQVISVKSMSAGKAISFDGTENTAHFFSPRSLILHSMVISIDLAQLDCVCPPQSSVAGRQMLTFVPDNTRLDLRTTTLCVNSRDLSRWIIS